MSPSQQRTDYEGGAKPPYRPHCLGFGIGRWRIRPCGPNPGGTMGCPGRNAFTFGTVMGRFGIPAGAKLLRTGGRSIGGCIPGGTPGIPGGIC